MRIAETDPDLIIADAFLPGRNGFDLCRQVKRWRPHVRVILTAGSLETFDEDEAKDAGSDAVLRKPFEASQAMALDSTFVAGSNPGTRTDGSVRVPAGKCPCPSPMH